MANGFLADRCNARRFMATGLLLTAIVNLLLGFSNMFIVLLFCGVSTAGFSQWVHLRVSYRSTAGMTTKTAVPITEYGREPQHRRGSDFYYSRRTRKLGRMAIRYDWRRNNRHTRIRNAVAFHARHTSKSRVHAQSENRHCRIFESCRNGRFQ